MFPKYKIEELINKYADVFRKMLGIRNKTKINFHVVNSQTKKYQDMNVSKADNMGLSLITITGNAEVFLYYDKHFSEREAVSTLFHELLHVRVSKLSGLVTLEASKAYSIEEKLVRDLEEMFMNIWWK